MIASGSNDKSIMVNNYYLIIEIEIDLFDDSDQGLKNDNSRAIS